MKIGFFTECYKPILNGVVNSIIGFKEGLERLGHEVYIFCPNYKNYKPENNKVIYCKSWQLPGKSGYHFIFPLDEKVKNIAKDMNIIHVQHPFVMGDIAADASREFNIPIAFTNHTQYDQYLHYVPFSKKFVRKELTKYIKSFAKRIDLIIAPAEGIKKKLESYDIKTPISIVPNGIDVARFERKINQDTQDKIRKKYNLKNSDDILVCTGRIAQEKNLGFLLKAFVKINQKLPHTKLLLVGGGPQLDKFNKMIRDLGLQNKAIITDFIPYSEIPDYLSLAKIYVTGSKSEVHPLTIIEGLAAKLPAVIVDAPGTSDIVTNNFDGLIAKDNTDDFSKMAIKLLTDQKLYKKLVTNTQKTAEKYSYMATSKIMVKAYNKTIRIHKEKI